MYIFQDINVILFILPHELAGRIPDVLVRRKHSSDHQYLYLGIDRQLRESRYRCNRYG